jgi:hypothetical protein
LIKLGRKGVASSRKEGKTARKGDDDERFELMEIDFDDRGTIFGQFTDRGRFFAHNKVGSIVVMREIVILLSKMFAEMDTHELDVLKEAYKKAEKFEELYKQTLPGIPDFQYNLQ